MDARLRAAVDASLRWYDAVFALHRIPTRRDATGEELEAMLARGFTALGPQRVWLR